MTKKNIIIIAMIIFFTGFSAGIAGSAVFLRFQTVRAAKIFFSKSITAGELREKKDERRIFRLISSLQRSLSLSEDQRNEIERIILKHSKDYEKLRDDLRSGSINIIMDLREETMPVLTDEQRNRLDKILTSRLGLEIQDK